MNRLILGFLFATAGLAMADGYRIWTEAASDKKIEAMIVDKRTDNSKVKFKLKEGEKEMWVEASRLIEKDQGYIKLWVRPEDHLTARIVGSKKGRKTVKVTARAGFRALKVVTRNYYRKEIVKRLKPGQQIEFTFEAPLKYSIGAWSEGKRVDHEAWNRKSGL